MMLRQQQPRLPARVSIASVEFESNEGVLNVAFDLDPPPIDSDGVMYAAAPPAERRASSTGSCLPFPNARAALEYTTNRGKAKLRDPSLGRYSASVRLPNSYYEDLGSKLVPPSLHVSYAVKGGGRARGRAQIAEPTPFRTLTHPSDLPRGAEFYDAGPEAGAVRSQEAILAASAYPSTGPPHRPGPSTVAEFWGGRPPC